MYPNLLGQKEFHHLSDQKMAAIIGVSRGTYCRKLRSGDFYPGECQVYCRYFKKPFYYLFATEGELAGFWKALPDLTLPVMATAQ